MENLFNLDDIEVDAELLERANPIFNTAKMTLYQLAASGDEDSILMSKKLGLTEESTQNSTTTTSDAVKLLMESLLMDMRYHTIEKLAMDEGDFTEVDLPCGYLPKALRYTRAGHKFVGLDLPATITEVEPVINSLLNDEQKKMVKFAGVDATNYESLKAALSDVDGKVVITTEGLMVYFNDSEIGALCDNVKKILDEHGGCWLTIDPEWLVAYTLIVKAILGDKALEALASMQKRAEDKSDVGVKGSTLVVFPKADISEDIKKGMEFLAKHGLKAERKIVADNMPELKVFEKLKPEQIAAVKEVMKLNAYWKITSMGAPAVREDIDTGSIGEKDFDVKAQIEGEKLCLSFTGRIDSLTAPKILSFYENTAKEKNIKAVHVDCAELKYISSAGLRVLLIMKKNSENGMFLENVKPEIMEILETTGFDSIFFEEN
ncbi:MAG: STAS domain-containing protein [Ruminiclostridium sp.]|nr:STAS domain-containing protein [Ruminiclostridium sp.]